MIIDCAHYKDGHRTDEGTVPLAEIADRRAQGGLAVLLVLLITWMRLRMPHVDTRAAVGEAAGAGHH